jgi:DNA-directed RNA polymerase specialized sigma24 family protein
LWGVSVKPSFEDKIEVIVREIEKRRGKWYLSSVSFVDYDDVAQIILNHVFEKWHLWDHSLALEPWLNRVITNQMKNQTRNYYGNFARPCINCPFNEGYDNDVNLCAFTRSGEQCAECPLYARWSKNKKNAYNIKIPLAYEHHSHEIGPQEPSVDMERSAEKLHLAMSKRLNDKHYRVYQMLFIENATDDEAARFMGYKTGEKNRAAGYKQIRNLKTKFLGIAKQILEEEDVI